VIGPEDALVCVVDDDAAVREALSSLLRSAGLRVETFSSAHEFERRAPTAGPTCLVLDVRLPGRSGLDLQRDLAERGDGIPIVFITAHGDIAMSVRAMKGGAVEFLPKPFDERDLLEAVRECLSRSRAAAALREEVGELRRRHARLTAREREVMERISEGLMNKQVAAALGISEITVKVHRRRVMEKMGAASLAEMVRMADKLRAPAADRNPPTYT
jgi:FixJ family two-component response regulator